MKLLPAKGESSSNTCDLQRLHCRVTPADVEAMLDAYDSGMCDLTTANCLSRAIARALGRNQPTPLVRHDAWSAHLLIEGLRIPIPPETISWLNCAEIGGKKGPFEFELEIPEDLAPSPPLSGEKESPASYPLLAS